MRKRILSALLAVMFLFTGLPGTAWAVGEGNMEAGGGQTETVTGDSFWNGDWGIRFCVVDVASQTVVSATYDASNRNSGFEDYHHYGKTNKFCNNRRLIIFLFFYDICNFSIDCSSSHNIS